MSEIVKCEMEEEWMEINRPTPQPSECGRQRTLNSVHGHTAARLQSNGNLAV